jgi:hypothetical protein
MKLVMGHTEIDFSVINNSDLIFNKSVEIPLQDLLTVCREHGPDGSILTNGTVDLTVRDRSEIARRDRAVELAEEQVFFAQALLNVILTKIACYPNTGGAKGLKADIVRAIEDSMFER